MVLLGCKIRELRTKYNLTQAELAKNRSESVLDVSDLESEQINKVQGYIKYLKEQELVNLILSGEPIDVETIEKIRKEWNRDI